MTRMLAFPRSSLSVVLTGKIAMDNEGALIR
uniref:Uncharacterized protein n=2 Tax=Anguilla anguilla TaxID=7936 RepID=A0A0E9Q2U7_ANGAN